MCGIAGIYDLKSGFADDSVIRQMTQALRHRGPDRQGAFHEGPVALGHCRLSIIDLMTGDQPMTGADGRYTVVFNGEIYNFREIRRALEQKGHHFRTQSDTESLLQLYEEKGADCVRELEGMFAFAIYDRMKKSLFLAVDRLGKKPLYYAHQGSVFAFASELKALLKVPRLEKTIDNDSLAQYLAFEYVPAPKTICKNFFKMEAATTLLVDEAGASKNVYWRPSFSEERKTESQWQEEFLGTFRESVSRRLVSDVPLGVFLSGGLDSSSVLAVVRELLPDKPIKTFSIGFDDPSFDESRYAKRVADAFGTEHVTERCSLEQMKREHESILATLDEPMADASYIPTYLLCRLTRSHVTVALSGDGGDELLLGYPTFEAGILAERLAGLPKGLLREAGRWVNRLPTSMSNLSVDFKLKQFFKGIGYPDPVRQQVWLGAFSSEETQAVLTPSQAAGGAHVYDPLKQLSEGVSTGTLRRLQNFYFKFYLQNDILVKVDRASMANSLEVRSPFLDERLMDTVARMPVDLLMRGRTSKYILKRVMASRLPKEVISRPKKGFGIPIARWIREDLREKFADTLSTSELKKDGLFHAPEVQRLLQEHVLGKRDHRKALWTLYVFQQWKRRYMT